MQNQKLIDSSPLSKTSNAAASLSCTYYCNSLHGVGGGDSFRVGDLAALRSRVRGYVNDAVRTTIPWLQSQAYLEALTKAPDLVEKETDPLQFVRYCGYDLLAGAKRLCHYWTERKKAFGEKRFFLPLTLTGNGALSSEDVVSLQGGYPALLPSTNKGQKVILLDRRKWIQETTAENRVRSLFYICLVLAEDDFSQVDGVLCLAVLATPRLQELPIPWLHSLVDLAAHCFPVKLLLHFVVIPQQKNEQHLNMIIDQCSQVLVHYTNKSGVQFHVQREPEQIVEELSKFGMDRSSIPLSLGGLWKFELFFKWCQERNELERQLYGTIPVPTWKDRSMCAEREDERLAKRRMADLLHSRRKRERKREKVLFLREEMARLMREHKVLGEEKLFLEYLVEQARIVVSNLDSEMVDADGSIVNNYCEPNSTRETKKSRKDDTAHGL